MFDSKNIIIGQRKGHMLFLVVFFYFHFHKGSDTHYMHFMYNLELVRLHVNFKHINFISLARKSMDFTIISNLRSICFYMSTTSDTSLTYTGITYRVACAHVKIFTYVCTQS